jgi:hypothetical protein
MARKVETTMMKKTCKRSHVVKKYRYLDEALAPLNVSVHIAPPAQAA